MYVLHGCFTYELVDLVHAHHGLKHHCECKGIHNPREHRPTSVELLRPPSPAAPCLRGLRDEISLRSHLFPEFEGRLATPSILPEHLNRGHITRLLSLRPPTPVSVR